MMVEQSPQQARKRLVRTILIIVGILLLYAFAVQITQINLERPLDPSRQDNLLRVLRLLADPDIFSRDEATGSLILSEATRITINRIVETIFMALLASAVGTALAVPVSFLAARNLMAPVTAPLAAIMAAAIALAVGGVIGVQIAQALAIPAALATDQFWIGALALLVVAGLIWFLLRMGPAPESDQLTTTGKIWLVLRLALSVLLIIFGLAMLALLGQEAGAWLEEVLGPLGFLGNFVVVLSDFLQLLLPAIVALIAAAALASLASRYAQEAVLRWQGLPVRLLTALLTAAGTAVIFYAIASFINWLYQFDNPQLWTVTAPLIGAAIAGVLSLAVAPKQPIAIGSMIYGFTRGVLNILRSIEPLIMGIVFVVWVSLGPFAGIMALTLHSIAALGKLFSEQVEGIDDGPIEAITATGASRLQMIVFAVIPQIVPPFTAFALYRWDINVRMSTIIGFVGGGGIGFVLSQNIQQLRYRQASVMMLAIAIVVILLDYASSRIRRRII